MPGAARTNLLPTTGNERTSGDAQQAQFVKEAYEKEAESYGLNMESSGKGLTKYQMELLDTIRNIDAKPCPVAYPGTTRTDAQVAASVEIHKRVNPGYVEMPYTASSQTDFVYKPPPDFTKAFLKKESDCKFQKYAAEAILKHVDLKKTSH